MDPIRFTYRLARRIAVAVIGSTILLIGVIMLVTPGPALVVIPIGLGILGIEFAWARAWLKRVRERISASAAEYRGQRVESYRNHDDHR